MTKVEHTMNWPNRRQGYDPNIHGPNANQGDGPIPVPREDTVDAERGAQALVLDVAIALLVMLALWVVFTGADK
jgi:hypothetical protein